MNTTVRVTPIPPIIKHTENRANRSRSPKIESLENAAENPKPFQEKRNE